MCRSFLSNKKNIFNMWKIRGKVYDLTDFLDHHPGGRSILEASEGKDDLTATFESYHALCNMTKIECIMKKYEIGVTEPSNFTFLDGGFYKTVQNRVRNCFASRSDYKANWLWGIKSLIQGGLYLTSFIGAFYSQSLPIEYRMLLSILSGHLLIQFGFGVMHDASHGAVSNHPKVNQFLSATWNSLALWDGQLWAKHHVIRHHAFTGDQELDPDVIHFKPFIRKLEEEDEKKYWKIAKLYPKCVALFTTCIFPGMFLGQGILYNLIWLRRGYMWKMKLPSLYTISWYQTFIKLLMVFSFVYGSSFIVFFAYIMSANMTYFACIMPDHDTFETHENRINPKEEVDWGILQVRHSGNFATENPWICMLFGGINYQIEHHLFPTISHVHFHKIKPIVEETCREFNVPYVSHKTVFDAIQSTLKNYSKNKK